MTKENIPESFFLQAISCRDNKLFPDFPVEDKVRTIELLEKLGEGMHLGDPLLQAILSRTIQRSDLFP